MMIKSSIVLLFFLAALGSITGCSRLPGKPSEKDRWIAPSEVADFDQLYSQNCAGCHGSNGRMGAARPLNDPLYLSIASVDSLREVTRKGVTGTAMPPFSIQAGGNLTDKQIDLIVGEMRSRWGRPDEFNNVSLPPYSLNDSIAGRSEPGNPQRGLAAYNLYCTHCHGPQGKGGKGGGSIVDPNFLNLVSDQSLRTTVIVGRADLGKPDWRSDVPGRPISAQEISDLVAWLASQRNIRGKE